MREYHHLKTSTMPSGGTDLGNQATLAKIDKLRELNVGAIIPLPQLVVVGDQSSGKSSVLESLTGFSFPRAPGLCTRYATQITCCREAESGVRVTIIPRPDADETLKTKLLQFKRHLSSIDGNNLANVFEEFSPHPSASARLTLLEQQQHLTVIDVPGIFRVPTPGLTTESDIFLIENMVNSYMTNPRTMSVSAILFGWLKLLTCSSNLAVIPCNVDIATQEILKLAELADPEGVRTMGVLTKPDLATETATRSAIIDLVLGKQSILRLGYYVVKNPCRFRNGIFMAPAWSSIADRCGTTALKCKVRELLMQISKQEFPHVKADIEQRLRQRRTELENMGPPRAGSIAQRMYLGKLASRFQTITQAALSGYYAGDDIFKKLPNLKLITQIMQLNEAFSDVFWKKGHKQHFEATMDDEGESPLGCTVNQLPFEIPLDKYPELGTIICTNEYQCSSPSKGTLMDHIKEVYESSRGPELGTKRRGKRMRQTFATMAVTISGGSADERHVPLSKIGQHTVDKDNKTQVCEDILDALMSYYKVSRKRFVDVICQQVVFHLLLEGDGSPLKVFDPELIMKLDDEHLEQIAGEDEASKHHRQVLKREIESLEAALKVLRV
ncbi:P-loop containing nucleoside triphosphate hydrolase protein [Phyllosticta citrichinensis]